MSKRSWIEDQCFRMCSSESVECTCLKELKKNIHTGSSMDEFRKAYLGEFVEPIVAQDHIEPEVTEGYKSEEDND
jgi:hypothetical protein